MPLTWNSVYWKYHIEGSKFTAKCITSFAVDQNCTIYFCKYWVAFNDQLCDVGSNMHSQYAFHNSLFYLKKRTIHQLTLTSEPDSFCWYWWRNFMTETLNFVILEVGTFDTHPDTLFSARRSGVSKYSASRKINDTLMEHYKTFVQWQYIYLTCHKSS